MEHLEASEFALRLFLLFLPGLVAVSVVGALTVHKKWTSFDVFAMAFVLGVSAYFCYWILLRTVGAWLRVKWHWNWPTDFIFLRALQDRSQTLSFREIGFVCFTAVGVAVFLTVVSTYKVFHWLARIFKISRKSGELDVWGYVFNAPRIQYATVRDYKHDLVYDGWVQGFSDDAKTSELFLRDVQVYRNSEQELLYDVGGLYLCVDSKEMVIEFRDSAFTEKFLEYRKERDAAKKRTESVTAASEAAQSDTPAAAVSTAAAGAAPAEAAFQRGNREEGRNQ